jgi:trehalose 6-phosphate phosphatase
VKDLLGERHRGVLERLAGARALLAFDYDGVLAPVVRDPGGAPMRRRTRTLLARLVEAWPVAVVSGRAFVDTRRLSEGVVPNVVGNHGYELLVARPVPKAVVGRVAGWRAALERDLEAVDGWFIEDKRSTLAVHYGLGRSWRATGEAVRRAAEALRGARLVGGKKVLNVIPVAFPDKGHALLALLARLRLDVALYLGDDVTDEDAFAVGPPRVVGVRVGGGRSLAEWGLRSQEDVDALMERLVSLRAGAGASTPPLRGSAQRERKPHPVRPERSAAESKGLSGAKRSRRAKASPPPSR